MALSDVTNEQLKRITNGLIEMDTSGGSIGFRVGDRSFRSIEAATDFITSMHMTNRETFQATRTLTDYLRAPSGLARGIQTPEGMINMAQRIGKDKRIEVYQLNTEKMQGEILTDGTMTGDYAAIKKNFTNEAGEYTALIMPGKTTVVQQYFDETLNRYLTADEIIGLHRQHGIVPFNEKAPKRYRQMTRNAEIMGQADKRYTVGVFDNEAVLRETYKDSPHILDQITSTKAAIAADGQSLMSPAVIEDLEKVIRDKKIKLEKSLGSNPSAIDKAAVSKFERQLDELKGLKIHGGRFNYRLDVFDFAGSSNLSNEEVALLQQMVGSPKGDILVPAGGRKAWSRLVQEYGGSGGFKAGDDTLKANQIHFLSTMASIPNDAGEYIGPGGLGRTRNSTVLLSPHDIIKDTWLDPQHLTAHPDLFTVDALHNETMAHFNRSLATLQETGTLPPGMVEQMRQHLGDGGKIIDEFNKSDKYAAHILDFIDAGGSLNDSPEIMRMAIGSLERFYQDPKAADRVKFMMPDAVRVPISPYDMAYATARKEDKMSTHLPMWTPEQLPQGNVSYVPGRGLAFHPLDFPLITEAGGGSDFDDFYVSHLRQVEGSEELAAIMTRSPTTMGEQVVMGVDMYDPLTEEVLKRKDPRFTFLSRTKKIDAAQAAYNNELEQFNRLQEAQADAWEAYSAARKSGNKKEMARADRKMMGLREEVEKVQTRIKSKNAAWNYQLRSSIGTMENIGSDTGLRIDYEDMLKGDFDRNDLTDYVVNDMLDEHKKRVLATVQTISEVEKARIANGGVAEGLLSSQSIHELQDPHALYRLIDEDGNAVTAKAYNDNAFKTIEEMHAKQLAIMEGSFTGDAAVKQVAQTSEELKRLGAYSNAKMIADDMLALNKDQMSAIQDIVGHNFKIDVPQLEQVIDSATSGGGAIDFGAKLKQDIGRLVAQVRHESDGAIQLGIDKTLFEDKASGASGDGFREGFQSYWNEQLDTDEAGMLRKYGVSTRESFFEKIRLEDNLVEGQYSENVMARKLAKIEMTREANAAKAATKYNSFYSNNEFAKQAHTDADFLEELYHRSRAAYNGIPPSMPEGIDNASLMVFANYDTVMEQGSRDLIGRDLIHGARLLAADADMGEERLFSAVGVLKQRHNEGVSKISTRILDAGGLESRSMRDVSLSTDRFYGAFSNAAEGSGTIRIPHGIGGDISDNVIDIAKEFYGENSRVRSTIGEVASKGMISFSEGLSKLGKVPGVRGIAAAGLAVVAGSILYQGHKDRTYRDMEGPPLLPGGSSYENYPVESTQISSAVGGNVARGTTYDIYADGNFDHGKVNGQIAQTAGVSPSVYSYKGRSKNSGGSMGDYVESRFK